MCRACIRALEKADIEVLQRQLMLGELLHTCLDVDGPYSIQDLYRDGHYLMAVLVLRG